MTVLAGTLLCACGSSSPGSTSGPTHPSASLTDENAVAGSCIAPQKLGPLLKNAASHGDPTVLARVEPTGRTTLSASQYVYTELRVTIHRTLAGSVRARVVTAYVIGGTRDGQTTSGGSESSVAWSPGGEVLASLTPSSDFAGAFQMESLPVINSSIAFVDVGCFAPIGYPHPSATHSVVFLRSGTRTVETVTYPAVPLRDIERSLR